MLYIWFRVHWLAEHIRKSAKDQHYQLIPRDISEQPKIRLKLVFPN